MLYKIWINQNADSYSYVVKIEYLSDFKVYTINIRRLTREELCLTDTPEMDKQETLPLAEFWRYPFGDFVWGSV